MTSIGAYAFYDCTSLTSVTIGNNVTFIGEFAFQYCHKLVEVYNLSNLNITAGSIDNGLVAAYAKDVYTSLDTPSKLSTTEDRFVIYANEENKEYLLIGYTGNETEITLPANINGNNYAIYEYAFYNYDTITSIIIPDSVISIGYRAFENCPSLANINIGNGVTSIDSRAFYYCTSLVSITIPDSVTSIADSAFYNCRSLERVAIGNGVTEIGDSAFSGCASLTSITIPNGVASIGSGAFQNCTLLTNITIGGSVKEIGSSAFYGCSSLESIVVESDNTVYHSSGNCIIETATKTLVVGCKTSEIPNDGSVTSIGRSTFKDCTLLESIIIPESVTSIDARAFDGCTSLEIVYYGGTESNWKAIDIDSFNSPLTNTIRYYYSETQPTEEGNFWHYDTDGTTPVIWTKETT